MFADLLNHALLGTNRQPYVAPVVADEQLYALLQSLQAQPPEKALLCTAGVLAAYQSAGVTSTQSSDPPASLPPNESLAECSARAAFLLEQVLTEQTQALLRLWIEQAAVAAQRAPAKHLVELLMLANSRSGLGPLIGEVIGERGKWLAMQNPDWSRQCVQGDDANAWTDGTLSVRTTYLRNLRAKDPTGARALLEEIWKQEPAKERAQFVGVFEQKLSMDDEPFLEQALDDRSKEVRATVASLLSRLPQSRFSQRMQDRAVLLIRAEKKRLGGAKLDVKLSEAVDDAMKRDALEERIVAGDVGKKASILYQVVASVPLPFWSEKYGIAPSAWLKLAAKSDWESPLVFGWIDAAIMQQNVQWLEAMLDDAPGKVLKEPARRSALITALPEDLRRARILALLQSGKFDEPRLMHELTAEWDTELSRAALKQLVAPVAAKKPHWPYGIRETLRNLATRLHPQVFGEAETLAQTPDLDVNVRDALMDFVEIYRLRCEILSEFATKART